MNIGGFEPCTLVDFPGKVACIVYTVGCNFRCKMCYNPDIISEDMFKTSGRRLIPESEVFDYIDTHAHMIDGVVITGGEPTVQPDLLQFCLNIKARGKLVKIDTNGSNPSRLKSYIDAGCVDFIAMDLKGPLNMYEKVCGYVNIPAIHDSIRVIKNSGVPHEFRLTLYPVLTKEDIIDTISLVPGETIYLQNFEPANAFSIEARNLRPFSRVDIESIAKTMSNVADVRLRGF